PDIDDAGAFGKIDAQQHVAARWDNPGGPAAVHPGRQPHGAKTEREQDLDQQLIVLVAIASAAVTRESFVQRWRIEENRPCCDDVEVLERDRGRVPGYDTLQRPKRRFARPGISDPRAVAIYVDRLTV